MCYYDNDCKKGSDCFEEISLENLGYLAEIHDLSDCHEFFEAIHYRKDNSYINYKYQ